MLAPGDRSLTVMSAVRAPARRAALSASFVARVPPSCEMPMTMPVRRWLTYDLEGGHRPRASPRRAPQRLGEHRRDAVGGVVGRPATDEHDRLTGARRRANLILERGEPVVLGEAPDETLGQCRLGGDHLGHGIRRAPAERRHDRWCPRVGGAGQRRGRIGPHEGFRTIRAMITAVPMSS